MFVGEFGGYSSPGCSVNISLLYKEWLIDLFYCSGFFQRKFLLGKREVDHMTEQSQLEDVDLVKAYSEFQNMELGLQAALQSYASVQKLSLFQYVS